jgi:bifunctional DNase/RNase
MLCDLCKNQAVVHVTVARDRTCAEEKHLCEAHGQEFTAAARRGPAGDGAPRGAGGTALFDIDLLVVSELSDIQVLHLREVDGGRRFPLVCGIFEATCLDRTLKRLAAPRPLTHDAWAATITALGGRLEDVVVSHLSGRTYHANLRIRQADDRLVEVDVRPSDACNLAVLCGAPIRIAEEVLAEVCGPSGLL